jgi:hypothetical protein
MRSHYGTEKQKRRKRKRKGCMRTERRKPLIQRRLIRIIAYPTHEDGLFGFGAFFHELGDR